MHPPDENASDQPLPGSVSNQNAEEAEPGHDDASAGSGRSSPAHNTEESSESGAGSKSGGKPDEGSQSGGESSEGSQSTGNPDSAG